MQAKSGSIAEIVTKTKETAEKAAQQQAEIKKNVKASKVNIKELAPSAGKWSVDPKIDMDTLTTKQTAAVSYLKAVSEVSGMNITLMSGVDVTGAFSVENGHYDGVTNTLYVSVNAGMQSITDITGSAILKTASHEITHYIAASGTQTYSLLEDYVLSRFTEQYGEKSVDNRIEDIQEQYKDQVGKELTREQAKEEMVAAACEMMLKNSEVFEKLARQNLTLAQRIKAGLDGFIKKLSANRKAAFENLDATSPEARAIAASEASLKETQKLWDNALRGAIKENEGRKSAGTGSMSEIRSYDYSKTFAQQIDDYKAGKFPRNDTLVVCGTPEVFQKIGLNALPMTYTQGHLRDALANVDGDHLGEALLKKLPAAMQDPLAIINSATRPGRLVAIVEIQGQTRNTIAAVEIDGTGRMHSYTIDANAITSAHSRDNAISNLLRNAVISELAGKNSIYYWQKNKAIQRLNGIGVQFPGASSIADGYIHSIRDAGSFVNTKFENVTQTQQFKRWFGDWQKDPKRASKVVNADGTPKIVYHGTNSDFWTFDLGKSGQNFGDVSEGLIFFTNKRDGYPDSAADYARKAAENGGKERVIECYLDIKKPLHLYSDGFYTPTAYFDHNAESIYSQYLSGDYDGIIIENSNKSADDSMIYMVDNPTQIKSATDNIGTFDRNNPDIRYELRDNQGRELTKAQAEKFKDSQVRDKDGRLKTVYHGSSAVFNVFSADFMSQHGSSEGQGFYFTDYKDMAEGYQKKGGQLLEGYLNITNPLSDSEVTLSAPEVKRLLKALDPTGDDVILNYDSQGGMGYPSKAWYNRALADTVNMIMSTSESDSEILAEIANAGAGSGNVMDAVRKVLGYDGYIVEGKYGNANVYVAFGSDQFKSFDNKTPTSSPDIHLELRSDENRFNPRKELSNLFMQIAQNEQEKKSLRSYQAAIHELNNTEIEISKLQQEMQGTDKLKSPQKYYELQNKLRQAEAKLNRYDGRLVQLEATKPMKDLIARREQRLKEQFARSSTTRAKYRNNIKKNIRSLDKKLRTNSGQKHVLLELQPVVAQLLNVFTENTSVFKKEQLARLREIYAKFSPEADSKISSTEKEVTRWKSTAEYSSAYSEMIYDLIEEVRPLVQGKRLIDLDTELLAAVNDIVGNIKQKSAVSKSLPRRRFSVVDQSEHFTAKPPLKKYVFVRTSFGGGEGN